MNIASPCIHICKLDAGDVCIGCQRTRDEIARWLQMNEEEKTQVNARLAERSSQLEAAHE
jgi:predicted Fe-S protein YdhL (DUF1289 family)